MGLRGEKPLREKGAREDRLEGERGAGGVEVQDGGRARGDKWEGGVGRVEPSGGGKNQGRKSGTGVEEGNTRLSGSEGDREGTR